MATKPAEEALDQLKYQVKNALIIDRIRPPTIPFTSFIITVYGLFLLLFLNPFLNCFADMGLESLNPL
jgi:hypothetical protein